MAYVYMTIMLVVGVWLSYKLFLSIKAGMLRVNFVTIEMRRWYFFWPAFLILAFWALLFVAGGIYLLLSITGIVPPVF